VPFAGGSTGVTARARAIDPLSSAARVASGTVGAPAVDGARENLKVQRDT